MNLAASFNKKYINYAIVMLTSFCESNTCHNEIFILHSELQKEDIEKIENCLKKYDVKVNTIDVSADIENLKLPTTVDWSSEMYYRLFLPEKLPDNVDRVLYVDVDVIVHGALDDLYFSDFEGADIMAALDSNNTNVMGNYTDKVREMLLPLYGEEFSYFNSGVLLMNIAQMREHYSFSFYLKAMEEWDYEMAAPDQDILNYVHHDKVKIIQWEKYDLFAKLAYNDGWSYEKVKKDNIIVHFAGTKPWSFDNTRYEIEKLWWDYAALTPINIELMEVLLEQALSNPSLEKIVLQLENGKEEYKKAINEAKQIVDKLIR